MKMSKTFTERLIKAINNVNKAQTDLANAFTTAQTEMNKFRLLLNEMQNNEEKQAKGKKT